MPSLHTIWALLIWFNVGSLSARLRIGLRAFVILTLWAVMGLDDTHWLTDVVVGVPLAVAVQVGIRACAGCRVVATLDDGHRVRAPDPLVACGPSRRHASPRLPAGAGVDRRSGERLLASWSTAAVGRRTPAPHRSEREVATG